MGPGLIVFCIAVAFLWGLFAGTKLGEMLTRIAILRRLDEMNCRPEESDAIFRVENMLKQRTYRR